MLLNVHLSTSLAAYSPNHAVLPCLKRTNPPDFTPTTLQGGTSLPEAVRVTNASKRRMDNLSRGFRNLHPAFNRPFTAVLKRYKGWAMEQWSRAIFHVFTILFDGTLPDVTAKAWAHLHRFAEFHLTAMSGDPDAYADQEAVDNAAAEAHEHLLAYARLAEQVRAMLCMLRRHAL